MHTSKWCHSFLAVTRLSRWSPSQGFSHQGTKPKNRNDQTKQNKTKHRPKCFLKSHSNWYIISCIQADKTLANILMSIKLLPRDVRFTIFNSRVKLGQFFGQTQGCAYMVIGKQRKHPKLPQMGYGIKVIVFQVEVLFQSFDRMLVSRVEAM